MKVRVEALKRGTVVAPSTGHQVHFDPRARRFPTARRPFVEEADVDYFVSEGYAKRPSDKARTYGDDQVREILRKETRSPQDGEQAARRVANAAAADAVGGTANSGLETRQVRNNQSGDGPNKEVGLGDEANEEDDAGEENDEGLDPDDPGAPPVDGAARQPRQSKARRAAAKNDEGKAAAPPAGGDKGAAAS